VPAPTHQLTLVADERRYDLVVPVGTRVTDVLSVLGISSSAAPSSVATAGGHVYGPHDRLGDDLPAGAVLTVVRTTTHRLHRDVVSIDQSSAAPGSRASAPAWAGGGRRPAVRADDGPHLVDDSTRRREEPDPDATVSRSSVSDLPASATWGPPRHTGTGSSRLMADLAVPVLAVGLALLCVVAAALGLASPPPRTGTAVLSSDAARWAASLALLASAVVVALRVPPGRPGAASLRLAASPALAVAAGLTVPLGASPQRLAVHGVLACALAVLVVSLGALDGGSTDRADRTAAACLGGLGTLLAAGVLLGWSPVASAALVLGLAPVLVRALPSASLAVDPTQLVDVDRLSSTVWAVRERHAGRRRRVSSPDVLERVAQARAVVSVGTAYLVVLASLAGVAVAASPARSDLAPWSRWALPAVAALAFGYQARSVRDRVARFAMLGGGAVLTAASTHGLLVEHATWALPLTALAVAVAAACVIAAVALSGGYRSTRLSRLSDRVESLAVVLVLPLGVVAAGGIEALRRLTSG
jgi:hypothetical protein